jgi:hypothetical protein
VQRIHSDPYDLVRLLPGMPQHPEPKEIISG